MSQPAKRRRQDSIEEAHFETTLRHSRACASCRRLKVKCDATAADSTAPCTRCRRLQLHCLREQRSWVHEQDGTSALEATVTKLERALEDVLERLGMPALDLYVTPTIVGPTDRPRSTRRGSSVTVEDHTNVASEPLNSLIEVTNLHGLRSELRSAKQRRKGGMSRMDADLISEKVITYEEGEALLAFFKDNQGPHLFSANIAPDATLSSIRASSTVLFTALVLVAALHIPGKEALHERCYSRFLGLVSSVMFDRFHTLDDIRGLCIAAFWQPYLNWKLSGLSVRMATELNLHHAFYEVFHEVDLTMEARAEHLERARLWYLLYVLDHQSSITYGRPSIMSDLRPIKDYEVLLNSDFCTTADCSLIAQVTGLGVIGRAFDYFGLEPKRLITGDDDSVLNHMRFEADIQTWRDKWVKVRELERQRTGEGLRGIDLHYHFGNLVLHSLVLRGRSLDSIRDLPASLRPSALKAIEAAHSILAHFLTLSGYRDEIIGMPLYLHSMIALSAVFLLKMSPRWHLIGITISPQERTIPLLEQVIDHLRRCNTGANHIVYSMFKGFERMLRQIRHNLPKLSSELAPSSSERSVSRPSWDLANQTREPHALPYGYENHGITETSPNVDSSYTATAWDPSQVDWGFQDGDLWSVGMGYDLLDPGAQGLASTDFPYDYNL